MKNKTSYLMTICLSLSLWITACGAESEAPAAPLLDESSINGEPRPVTFNTTDGNELTGTLFGQSNKGVIFSNMNQGDETAWHDVAEVVADKGLIALTYNYQGLGRTAEIRAQKKDDLNAAIGFMQAEGVTEVILVGASIGGAASVKAATDYNPAGLIVVSTATTLQGLEITGDDLQNISAPKLFLNSEADRYGTTPDSEIMFEMASEPKELLFFSGNDHGTELLKSENRDAVIEKIVSFILASLAE